ncbi:MAG: RidA family protein [Acidimicrobiaceae bacterium]|nr:RidA family protein [Acidimicrobiaceae bacterium]
MTSPHRIINPESLPKPVGYSHAIVAAPGRTVYLGGQAALEADGFTVIAGGLVEQFERSLYYVIQALEAAGGGPEHLVSMQVFITDAAEYRANLRNIGKIWQTLVGHHYPAMTLLQVSGLLFPGLLVELLATAVIPG